MFSTYGTLLTWDLNERGQLGQPHANPLPHYIATGNAPLAGGRGPVGQLLGVSGPVGVHVFSAQDGLVLIARNPV